MKSFHFYLREPIATPKRYASDMPLEERAQLRETFAPSARRFRFSIRIAYCLIAAAGVCMLLGVLLPNSMFNWIMGGTFLCWVLVVSMMLLSPRLVCPACSNKLELGFGPFCPECGENGLEFPGWPCAPHCSACGRDMRRRKTRFYRIRACSYCGLWLDDEGL
jgi:hypothetical protein